MPWGNELFKVMGIIGMKGNGRLAARDEAGPRRRRWLGQWWGHTMGPRGGF